MSAGADREALALVVSDSLETIAELADSHKLRPHLKLILRVTETASSATKRLAQELKDRPARVAPVTGGPTLQELEPLLAMLRGEVCLDCGGSRPAHPLIDLIE